MTIRLRDDPMKPWLRRWPLVIAITVLILGAYAATIIWHTPYLGVLRSIHDDVYRVEPASPGAAAGIQVGDRLTHVDGVPIHDVVPLFGTKRAGDTLSFSLIRDGAAQTIDVILETPPLGVRVRHLSYLAIAFAFWLVGAVVLGRRPAQTVPRLFFALCMTTATTLAVLGLSEIQLDWASRLVNVCVLFLSALFIHFHAEFPRRKQTRVRRPFLVALYVISLGSSILYAFVGPRQLGRSAWFPLLRSVIRLYFAAAIVVGLGLLLHTYRGTDYGPVCRRVRLVLFGTFVALMPVVLLSLVPVALQGYPIVPDEIVALSLVVIPLVYSYGILRHNLMGVDLVINLTVVYLTLSTLLMLLYLAVVTVVGFVLSGVEGLVLSAAEGSGAGGVLADPRLMGAIASLVVAASFLPLRTRVQATVDRLFYRQPYDYQALVGELSERLSRTLYEGSLEDILVGQLSRKMGLKGAALLLAQGEGDGQSGEYLVLQEATGTLRGLGRPGEELLPAQGSLARYLAQAGAPVDGDILPIPDVELRMADVPPDKSEIRNPKSEIRLGVPLVLGDELQGALLLGARYTDEFFSREDHKILTTLAHQAALAAKNLRLVEEQRQHMAEIEADRQMLREMNRLVVQSREEERKKLSWELHDQLVQDVIGLKLQVEKCRNRVDDHALRGQLEEAIQQAQQIIDDMRGICSDLRPAVIDSQGLMAALHSYIDDFEARTGLSVQREFQREDVGLSEEWELSLFRVVQEALQNVRRHAKAQVARVRLTVEDDSLKLLVADDGQGFVLPQRLRDLARQQHIGLIGMRERVEAMGGELSIHSQPGQGTSVRVTVPLARAHPRLPANLRFSADPRPIEDNQDHNTPSAASRQSAVLGLSRG